MYVKSIKIKNFKCFKEEKEIFFTYPANGKSGLNIFVGENNTGKSTIFEAFDFIRNGLPRGVNINDLRNKDSLENDKIFVEISFVGNIEDVIENFAQKNKIDAIKKYIFNQADEKVLKIKRESSDPKKILLWDNEKNIYKNEAGIEAPIQKFFELDFIWADTNPDDITKFGNTTICGKLLGEIARTFQDGEVFKNFILAHSNAFNDEQNGLKSKLKNIAERVSDICKNQFGEAHVDFHFEEVDALSFFKNTRIKVDDGIETYLEEKGSGMQRSVALALLQVFAENITKNSTDSQIKKPFYLFIDEPEICLHPLAQIKLTNAFKIIGEHQQIFFTTHSPLIFRDCCNKNIGIFLFDKNFSITNLKIDSIGKIPWGPTWGEINYFAYNLPTVELHNDLYGYLEKKYKDCLNNNVITTLSFEQYLEEKGIREKRNYFNEKNKKTELISICSYVRNQIHHPENKKNNLFTPEDLELSIKKMYSVL